jgi:two-component system OmpR family response regulator
MRILIIEDDLEAAGAMSHGLTEAGYDCVHAPDGEAGLTEAGKGGFDVMIVDRMMPKKNGVEVVETLRREGTRRRCCSFRPWARSTTAITGLRAGADDYLVKPYAFVELIARVDALARRRETGARGHDR